MLIRNDEKGQRRPGNDEIREDSSRESPAKIVWRSDRTAHFIVDFTEYVSVMVVGKEPPWVKSFDNR